MLGSKRKGIFLPYGNLVTNIMEYTRFNFGNEVFGEDVTKIGQTTLAKIRYEIIDGKLIEKHFKEKKRRTKVPETPVNLEVFDYHIHVIPSAEELRIEIIKKQKRKNDKINFLTFQFSQDLRHLPPGMFNDADEDNEE